MTTEKKTRLSNLAKTGIAFVLIILIILSFTGINYYFKFFGPNVTGKATYLYIPTGSSFEAVADSIKKKDMVMDTATFRYAAVNMDYLKKVKPGRYRLEKGMSNRKLINMLKAGNQEPVKIGFQNIRLKENFAAFVSQKIEPDSLALINLLDSASFIDKYGFTKDNVYVVFIPNSYEMYWNTSPEKFFLRMYDEYQKFWTEERKSKASKIGLNPIQVSIMASIVDAEALHDKEMPMIAGLYMNRINKGMRLEADPTVIFANNDYTIRRVLNRHLRKESPYNTYLNTGLPPGPINMPSIHAIDAVLNYVKHDYIYMCAKEDFSGTHNYASSMADHLVNARKFQKALNQRNIKN